MGGAGFTGEPARAAARALTSPALLSRPLPPSHTGRGGRKQKGFLPLFSSPGEGGREGSGEGRVRVFGRGRPYSNIASPAGSRRLYQELMTRP
jgi:hypothetical protein